MRINRLDLLRYGRFTDLALQFPATELDFHIIFGANEAGKSTSLTAIEDFLFGIRHNSPFNFIHDYATMRVGAVVQHEKESLEVRRRKGNKDTLLGPDDTPLGAGDLALAPFLGGVDHKLFTRMFSLNHERLARGGREILEAKDEVGQTLFSAGAGVAGLHERIAELTKGADELWAPRRASHRKYYKALDAFDEATKEVREYTVTASNWHEAKRNLDAAQESCEMLEQELELRTAEQRKLNRIRRVYRDVRRLSDINNESLELRAVILLPEDAGATLESAIRDVSDAHSRIEELEAQLAQAQEERAKLSYDEALVLRAEDIQRLHIQRIEVQKEKVSLPKRRAELETAEARLHDLADELGWSAKATDDILAQLPQRAKLATARALLTRRGGLASATKAAKEALDEVTGKHQDLTREFQDAASGLDVSALAAVIAATRDLGEIGSTIKGAEVKVAESDAAIAERLKSLRPQTLSEQTLVEIAVPPRSVVQERRDDARALEEKIRSCDEGIHTIEGRIAQLRKAYDRKIADEDVVPQEELARARKERDEGWSLIRRHYIEGNPASQEELSQFSADAADVPQAYEVKVAAADRLADTRFDKAQAAGEIAAIARQIEDQQDQLTTRRGEKTDLEAKAGQLVVAWKQLWDEAPFESLAPDFMLKWLDARGELIGMIERRTAASVELAALKDREVAARSTIIAELTALAEDVESLGDKPLRIVLEAAIRVQQRHEKQAENSAALKNEIRKLDAEASRKKAALEKADTEWRDWKGKWQAALSELGLNETASVEAIADQLDTVEEMRGVEKDIVQLRRERIGKIERDIESFAASVADFVENIAPDLTGREPDEAVVDLERRLEEAQRIHDQQVEKNKALASLKERIKECERARSEAERALRDLQDVSGTDGIEQLRQAIDKSRRKRELDSERARIQETLVTEGDGLPLAELEEECQAVDLDQIAARETTLRTEIDDLRARQTEAAESRVHARRAFDAIGGDNRAARAAAARQEALASMRDVAEEYVRVRTAATLLRWVIERYRREKQAPLLRRAGQMFATLTSQSFHDLRVEYDDQDNARLVGIRPEGSKVNVAGMSDGTADQLYLALRLASVDEYLSRAHPLPFVVDDLFINFDDRRATAGFQVLADLSRKTQVLFFTHHQHLVDIAKATLGKSINVVHLGQEREATSV